MRQGGLILAAGRVRSKKKKRGKKNTEKKSAPPKTHHEIHSSPATASNSRPHARKHVPRVSPYSLASIDPGFVEIGLVQPSQLPVGKTASVASFPRRVFLFDSSSENREKKNNPRHRHQQSSQRPSQGIPLPQNCEAALERVSDPLGARGNILPASVGSAPTWSESLDDIQESANLTWSCRLFERAPRVSQVRRWPFDIVLLITAGVLLPIPSPPTATDDSWLGSVQVALGASEKSCKRKLHLVEKAA